MAELNTTIDIEKVWKDTHPTMNVVIQFKQSRNFIYRLKVAKWLCQLAGYFVQMDITIVTEPDVEMWLYYCPKCSQNYTKPKPDYGDNLTISCPHCFYQILVIGDLGGPMLVKPDEDDFVDCEYECHWAEPFGFVPEDGCPVHDRYLPDVS